MDTSLVQNTVNVSVHLREMFSPVPSKTNNFTRSSFHGGKSDTCQTDTHQAVELAACGSAHAATKRWEPGKSMFWAADHTDPSPL